ncbi:MAG: TSUP family transporter [Gammaproteobacteria bacterium]|nr:TSUP family transporter [Gammaproteobacteria bacterium]
MILHLSWLLLSFLFACSLMAGIIDTIAGGGGLITVPALLAVGIPPGLVLGTNKLQACFGSGTAATRLMQYSHTPFKDIWIGSLYCLIGASLGTFAVLLLQDDFLQKLLPLLLAAILLYSIASSRMSAADQPARLSKNTTMLIFGLVLGFYDGFFGPGTGSFWVVALVFFLGYNLQKATIHAKVYNFTSNIVALIWFIVGGHVIYSIGLLMALGQFIGAHIGAKLIMQQGAKLIKPLFIAMVSIMLLIVILKTY